MLFNSFEFIFAFLPVVFYIYFLLNKRQYSNAAKIWLILSSLFFYSWWNLKYLPLILLSVAINYLTGYLLAKSGDSRNKKVILITGLVFNIGLLGYFKYYDFFIFNANLIFPSSLKAMSLLLPLGISFFTFTQIAYLVDTYKGIVKDTNFFNYILFVTFFPHLLAGPIIHHKEMMPQFDDYQKKKINYENICLGTLLFFIGLVKKIIIADTFAVYANGGFDDSQILTFLEAWGTSLAYTFQIYFDFSGYTDMAIGSALFFNIKLPFNFNSPYKALNIQDFWKRWHMTLSRFLKQYIYIPLGGNRKNTKRTYVNILAVFLIGGLWHGAGWTFIFWGFLHGVASILNKIWQKFNFKMNRVWAWFITFNFINITWVFFRASDWDNAVKVLKGMFGFSGFSLPLSLHNKFYFFSNYGVDFTTTDFISKKLIAIIIISIAFILLLKNSIELTEKFMINWKYLSLMIFLTSLSLVWMAYFSGKSDFIYYNF